MAAVAFVAVDRLQQPERGDLEEVLEGLGGAAVAAREAARERHVAGHELLAGGLVAVALPALEQARGLGPAARSCAA